MFATGLGVVAVFALPGTRTSLIPAFSPFIESVRIASNSNEYRLELTINNPLETPLLLSSVQVEAASSDRGVACCCGEVGDYKILETVVLTRRGEEVGDLALSVTSLTGGLSGYESPARGRVQSSCGDYSISIAFLASVELAPRKRSAFFIQFPRKFTVTENNSRGGLLDPAKERLDLAPIRIQFPDPHVSPLQPSETARISLQLITSSGERLERVLEFSGRDSSTKPFSR
jgi:hypothetical protein